MNIEALASLIEAKTYEDRESVTIIEKVQRPLLNCMSFKMDNQHPARGVVYKYMLERHGVRSLKYPRKMSAFV